MDMFYVQLAKSHKKVSWTCRGSNPGPFTCKANALPLRYKPLLHKTQASFFVNFNPATKKVHHNHLGSDKFIDFLAGLKLALDSVGSLLSSVLQMYITQFLQYSVSVCVF